VANDGGRDTRRLEEELSDLLSANVKIKMGGRGRGKLQIDFGDLDALEGILGRLRTGAVNGKQATTDNVSAAQA
jgi:ParB family chromosome partitioning protein